MAFFKDTAGSTRESGSPPPDALQRTPSVAATAANVPDAVRRTPERPEARHDARAVPGTEARESILAAGLAIEGKIEGAGHVRIAGRFKGDVNVQGNLTIEAGAHLAGQVRARNVIVAGELHGNIDGADRVELLETGLLIGDLKVGSLTVAGGSRMRGQVEFGWGETGAAEKAPVKPEQPRGNGSAA